MQNFNRQKLIDSFEGIESALNISQLSCRRTDFVMKDLSLVVPRGYCTGLIGPSGSGKTTLIQSTLGLITCNAGSVELFGQNIAHLRASELCSIKQRVAYVFAENPSDSIARLSNLARTYQLSYEKFDMDKMDRLVEKFGLVKLSDKNETQGLLASSKKIMELSRGQMMLFQILLALSSGADLLIMDEPTAGLDPLLRLEVLDLLRSWMAEDEKRTILMTSHITSDFDGFADFVYSIEDGHNLGFISSEELDDKGIAKLTYTQLEEVLASGIYKRGELVVIRHELSCSLLVPSASVMKEMWPNAVIERAAVGDSLVFDIKGEVI